MLKLPKKLHPDFAFPEKKPVGKVQIDRDNFFGRSAVFCNAGSGTDVADGSLVRLKMARLNPSASPRVHTGDLYFYADHGGSDDDELESVQTDLPTLKTVLRQTLMVRFVPTYYNANSHTICHNTLCLGFYIQLNPSGTHRIGYYGNNGFNYYGQFSADKIVEHKLNTIAISVDGVSKKLSLYVNGHRLADAGVVVGSVGNIGQGTISSYDKLLFSNSGYTNYYHFKGRLTQVALFHDYFSEDQLAQLAIDPYQILKPANDLYYFSPVGGGGPTTHECAAAFSQSFGISTSKTADYSASASFSQSFGMSQGGAADYNTETAFSQSFDAIAANIATIVAQAQTGITSSMVAANTAIINAGATIHTTHSVISAGGLSLQAAAEFAVTHALATDSDISIEALADFAMTCGLLCSVVNNTSASADFGMISGAVAETVAILNAQAQMGISSGLSVTRTFVTDAGITCSITSSYTASGAIQVVGSVTTPGSRTLTILADSRTLTITLENRTLTIEE